jgi:cob(I)alamin adenosyltransferase
MKIYTKQGDDGTTGLWGGARVSKASLRVAAYGEVDALNSWLGVVRTEPAGELDAALQRIQEQLFHVGAELASDPASAAKLNIPLTGSRDIEQLEGLIDDLQARMIPLKQFILPGGSKLASYLHLARTTCRSAERTVVLLRDHEPVREELVRYLNRLSDLLFVMARFGNQLRNVPDVTWSARSSGTGG